MAKTYQQFKSAVLGKAYDIDGYYGAQCWDGVMYYLQWLGYAAIYCGLSGYVKDIYIQKETNGIKTYCLETYDLQPGDIVVFKECSTTPWSHIAIFDSDAGGGYGWFLGQNQGGTNGAFNVIKLPYATSYYWGFRPRCLAEAVSPAKPAQTTTNKYAFPANFTREDGVFTITEPAGINTRNKQDLSAPVKYTFAKGSKIRYDGFRVDGAYVWITYKGNTERRYMVCGETKGTTYNADPWGTFGEA